MTNSLRYTHLKICTATAFLVCLTLSPTIAQEKAEDPHGWTKAKWGMTQDEIQKIFPEAIQTTDRVLGRKLTLRGFKIGRLSYAVRFVFGPGSEGLIKVFLLPEGEPAGTYAGIAQDSLRTMLTDKYGQPTQSSERDMYDPDGKDRQWKWVLSETEIKLGSLQFRDDTKNYTVLTYRKKEKSDAL